MAVPICLRLLEQLILAAASRTFWTAGRRRPMRMAMMAMTTNSSISVKPRIFRRIRIIPHSFRHARTKNKDSENVLGNRGPGGGHDGLEDRKDNEGILNTNAGHSKAALAAPLQALFL